MQYRINLPYFCAMRCIGLLDYSINNNSCCPHCRNTLFLRLHFGGTNLYEGLAFHWRCNKKNQIRVSAANCHINTGCAGHGESDADRDANDQLDGITRQSATSVQIVAFAFGPKQSLLWTLQFLANQSVVLTNRRPILASPQLCIYGAYVSSS